MQPLKEIQSETPLSGPLGPPLFAGDVSNGRKRCSVNPVRWELGLAKVTVPFTLRLSEARMAASP